MAPSLHTGPLARIAVVMFAAAASACVQTANLQLDRSNLSRATLDGVPIAVLVDTGCEFVIIDNELADKLELRRIGTAVSITDGVGETRPATRAVHFGRLQVGTITASGTAPTLALPEQCGQAVIGMDPILRACCTLFDSERGVLHMTCGDLGDDLVARAGMSVQDRLPIGGTPTRPMVRVRLLGRAEAELLLDTGATSTSLPASLVAELALPLATEACRRESALRAAELKRSLEDQLGPNGKVDVQVVLDGKPTTVGVHGRPIARTGIC